ncbi:homogentisate 1,2-dioxygenase [Alicyclobacillus ferrooxydans]|uniref:homogentisate 1,2-dioxygenase n=1 Tax=Alicyclobacillus ferrooxydans TaxID=471514 RepID=UPI000B2C2324|nr:homogentisate 1,2-dioxygenase [Alicyclobacillus ferrooxydans]
MPFYVARGSIPHKRHTQFRRPDGELYKEEVFGTKGFSGVESILYHVYAPTAVQQVGEYSAVRHEVEPQGPLRHRHFRTFGLTESGHPIDARQYLLGNADVQMAVCTATQSMQDIYKNAECDELLFIHEGTGILHSMFGDLAYRPGDYLVIPAGTMYQMAIAEPTRYLLIESVSPIEIPRRYRNEYGQLLEHAPFCERDIRVPEYVDPVGGPGGTLAGSTAGVASAGVASAGVASAGAASTSAGGSTNDGGVSQTGYPVRIKARGGMTTLTLEHHPFDVIGWDGYVYPYALNIEDFEPITGRIHQPPPVHQTFAGEGFVVCSFVPRLFDYHPESIPAPYNHSNIDSDEVLYYVRGNFMSRKGIEIGSITLHPSGIPHGPHPGTAEASIGKPGTEELAVMMDTFRPLQVLHPALTVEDEGYMFSWQERKY